MSDKFSPLCMWLSNSESISVRGSIFLLGKIVQPLKKSEWNS